MSGGTHQRPGYQAMLTAARAHSFDTIICEDVSRLWRNRAEFGPRSAELEDLGVHCLTCVGDDTRRDGWGLVIQIKQAVAEHARREASYRTRRGLEGNAIAGKSTGGRAYGYVSARDSASGQIEIEPAEAAIVRRIFEQYASGISPRTIAATFNSEGIPSPGARWNRTIRRRDRKWLASAIHGDVNRGTGILNNRRYVGVTLWGRSEWKRSAVDSKRRKFRMLADGSGHEQSDERLRIVSQELWERVKARQKRRTHEVGMLVRGGLRRRVAGAGRPPRHVFSGLLSCGVCDASYTLRNRQAYCCASHWNGGEHACSNSINVSMDLVQNVMLAGIREDLRDVAVLDEIERRFLAALRRREQTPAADHGRRIAELQIEVDNLVQAIATGAMRGSTAIAQRLQAAESELERRRAEQRPPRRLAMLVPDIRGRALALVDRLDEVLQHDPERGREELRGVLGERIKLLPDESGRFLWADYALGFKALLPNAEIMVAGVGFEPTTFGL